MNSDKQKLLIEYLISSADVLLRCMPILNSEYFDPEYRPALKLIMDYVTKFNSNIPIEIINAETSLNFSLRNVTADQYGYACEEIEKFVKNEAVRIAIETSIPDIQNHKYDSLVKKVQEASSISLEMDLGIDLFENVERNLIAALDTLKYYPCGIEEFDQRLGGFARKQFTLFSANSGVGKSVMLSNLGFNYASMGFHVLYISLELSQEMVNVRNSVIGTNVEIKHWKENINLISKKLEVIKDYGAGSYIVKRLPSRTTTATHIRSYIKQYQLKYKRTPDVLIVDYLDLMGTQDNGKKSGWEMEIQKSEELYEVGILYDMIMFSASQQNKGGLETPAKQDAGIVAGAMAKINIVDNHISLYMNLEMRTQGIMMAKYHKTRSSGASGEVENLKFDAATLRISSFKTKSKFDLTMKELIASHRDNKNIDLKTDPVIIEDISTTDSTPTFSIADSISENDADNSDANLINIELASLLSAIEGM